MSRITGILRRTFGIVREHVGTDHFGNNYYFIPEQTTWTGKRLRAKRMVVPANPAVHEYTEGNIPIEWDAWIRGRRKEPPSIEELTMNESYRQEIKLKTRELEEKDRDLQAEEYKEGLVARTAAKGHAAATVYGKQEVSEEPSSTANTFQPGSWMPSSKK
ncbi:NADH dehydrogenase [ubiquinone] 1 alpha subcomplex assembly factor 2 [Kryptolebias marmoratus]|uniref:NADH:ubiquinone oxidoreductase complex assembly factor 2 n=1 Tax=Kryptolebias marmoratus TaxID=37003 RepID=A0A3Q3B605_KRYMA|nr:NADH dehydrogenase [ubiquinone] 1 alpha subcomplex assembly factor 2 [Kryptolebias marmoratus]